jgi:hypothetical protein
MGPMSCAKLLVTLPAPQMGPSEWCHPDDPRLREAGPAESELIKLSPAGDERMGERD